MLLSRSTVVNLEVCGWTYFKQVRTCNPNSRISSKSVCTTVFNSLPHFTALNSRQKDQIHWYVDALLQWNKRMNLTAVKEVDEVMERHVEDSLAILPPLRDCYRSHCGASYDKLKLVDVGTGAGLPGIILAIACPEWDVTLLESMNKRCVFLEHAVGVTGLSNVQIVRGRAENDYEEHLVSSVTHSACSRLPVTDKIVKRLYFHQKQNLGQNLCLREQFDIAVARAVAEMRILAEYCLPLVRVGGLFIAAKGYHPEEEVRKADGAFKRMGASLLQVCSVESQSRHGQRTAVICLKDRPTPKKYPRDPGTPAKEPL